jgi:hypothetical protein
LWLTPGSPTTARIQDFGARSSTPTYEGIFISKAHLSGARRLSSLKVGKLLTLKKIEIFLIWMP